MHRPRIGIPLSLDDRGRWRADRDYLYIDERYAQAIDHAGGCPIHLPIQSDPRALVEDLDGLLLPGGDDFPSEVALPEDVMLDPVPERQLVFDEALFAAARARFLPILGICYGMQLMARARGGRLEAHLPTHRPDALEHRLPADGRHPITLLPSSRLAAILETDATEVNSLHHQAVQSVGAAYHAVAHGPDGVIEAIEVAPDSAASSDSTRSSGSADPKKIEPWEIGVQWHPEKMQVQTSERLFAAFVEACRDTRSEREHRS